MKKVVMETVKEYGEGLPVELLSVKTDRGDRVVIQAANEAGYNCTRVDLQDLLDWLLERGDEVASIRTDQITKPWSGGALEGS